MFIQQGKTNWTYLFIVIALAFAVGGIALLMSNMI